jgi:glycosyltransferase involved in cell wall biosynthesis
MAPAPRLSVVMPARNVRAHVDSAIESILAQTLGDFEFVIRDDGSSDGTGERLRHWARRDPRIRLFEGARLGPVGSSNWLVREARAPLVARMDADDVARPDRLDRQVGLLDRDPALVLVGALSETIDVSGRRIRGADYWRVGRRSCFAPFPHTSIMFRRSAFDAVGGYRERCDYWEDLDLYLRLAEQGSLAVVAEPLVSYRLSAASCRRVAADRDRIEAAVDRAYAALERYSAGRTYDPRLLPATGASGRVRPMVLVSLHAMRLWAGERPHLLRRLLRRGRLGPNAESLLTFGWAILGAASPGALRLVLRALNALRNRLAAARIRRGGVYRWKPHRRTPPALAPAAPRGPVHAASRTAVRPRPSRPRSAPARA